MFGDLRAAHAQGVAGVLHLAEALAEHVQLLGHLVGARVADVGEAVVDLPQELAQLEGGVDVAVAHAADAKPHQLAAQVGHAQQVVGGGHLEGQGSRWPGAVLKATEMNELAEIVSQRAFAHSPTDLGIQLLCPCEHQPGVDLLQADEAAVTDIMQERRRLHKLLNPWRRK